MATPPTTAVQGRAASVWALGFVILAVGHLLTYLALTADARGALAALDRQFDVAALPAARDPGAPPQPGGAAYTRWLGAYERWWASKDLALQRRHEGLMRGGMLLSFLIGLGLLGQGLRRAPRRPHRAAGREGQVRRRGKPRPPLRPLRPLPQPVAVRPILVRHRRSA